MKQPPSHLSAAAKRWWAEITDTWSLEAHDFQILEVACSALDRVIQARRAIKEQGMFTLNRFGQTQPHPAVKVEKDAQVVLLRAIRELDLSIDPPTTTTRIRGRK